MQCIQGQIIYTEAAQSTELESLSAKTDKTLLKIICECIDPIVVDVDADVQITSAWMVNVHTLLKRTGINFKYVFYMPLLNRSLKLIFRQSMTAPGLLVA